MKKSMRMRKKALFTMFLAVLMLVALVLPANMASAAVDVPKEGKFHIHKVRYVPENEDEDSKRIHGNGTEINLEDLPGASVENGAIFNIIEIKEINELGENPTQEEAANYFTKYSGNGAYDQDTGTTTGEGLYITKSMRAGRYLIYEEKVGEGAIQTSAPIVLSLPLMNQEGTGWLSDIHVYAKNVTTLGAANLFKYKGEFDKINAQAPLAGAKFNLYRVGKGGEEDVVIEADLLTGFDGFTPTVSNLVIGNYYFQETSAPGGYLLNGTKYHFSIASVDHAFDKDGKLLPAKIKSVGSKDDTKNSVPNYLAPTIDKIIFTKPTADIGQTNTWHITSDIPKNITQYKQYVITDTLDGSLDYKGKLTVTLTKNDNSTTPLNPGAYEVIEPNANSQLLTVKIKDSDFGGAINQLDGFKSLTIAYDTQINKGAVPAKDIPNSATLTYNNGFVQNAVNSFHTPVVVMGGRQFLKVNTSKQTLAGAEFRIYRKNGDKFEYLKQDSAMNVTWVPTKEESNIFISKEDGTFELRGVAYGEYYLEEIKAPKGYNLLAKDVYFVIDKDSYLPENTITIQNSNQPVIPVTGGMGTTIFFIAGILLMAGSVCFVVIKSKKNKKSEVHK